MDIEEDSKGDLYMRILGVHVGHDSSAALVIDGETVADVAEERFVRIKHFAGLPIHSIDYCLEAGGIKMADVDIIATPSSWPVLALNHIFELPKHLKEKSSKRGIIKDAFLSLTSNKPLRPPAYYKTFSVNKDVRIEHVDHHTAHAASAYYTSGAGHDEDYLVVTMDGAGNNVSIGIFRGRKGKLTYLKQWGVTASLGLFYSLVTEGLGWWHGDGEGKTMGLAPYGNYAEVRGCLNKFHPSFVNGELVDPHNFGKVYAWPELGSTQWHLEEASECRQICEKFGRQNIAAEAQRILEEQVFEIIFPWLEKENTKNLACAGGTFLNVKLNQRLWNKGVIEKQHIFPNSGDSGLALGSALYTYHKYVPSASTGCLRHLYLGPEYGDEDIEKTIRHCGLKYNRIDDIASHVGKLLSENKIVGWFQGRMESGPRALGSRSILMSPCQRNNKDIINARVKYREAFRPFCPSVLFEDYQDILDGARPEYFMITSFDAKLGMGKKIPAVVHVDGTVRPQMVTKDTNPLYWNVINEFKKYSGIGAILNTSFNIMGEPIVCNPYEAIRCFFGSGMDCLSIGNYVLEK
jgi:carbamoyltransferase